MSEFKKDSAEVAASPFLHTPEPKAKPSGFGAALSPGLLSFDAGLLGTAPGVKPASALDPSAVMNFMADGAAAGLATGATTPAAAPKKEYVDMTAKEKTNSLVDVMDSSRDVLTQNGVGTKGEEYLAGIMRNEGGRNERRQLIGNEFNKDADALRKLDINNVSAKQLKKLSADQRALLEQAQAGKLDLNDHDAVQGAGITRRTEQYERMEELRKKPAKELTKEEKAEFASLKKVHVAGGGRLDDFHGMSGDRFGHIFDEGQTRFELAQYKQFRNSYETQGKQPGKPGEDMTVSAGIGKATLDPTRQAKLQDNYDLFADYSTSYGTSQIMGLYAEQGQLTSKNGKGEDHTYSLDELKGSAQRMSPNSEDVGMQLAFMKMKNINMKTPPSALSLATKYNGPKAAQSYADKMTSGANDYRAARAAHDHP